MQRCCTATEHALGFMKTARLRHAPCSPCSHYTKGFTFSNHSCAAGYVLESGYDPRDRGAGRPFVQVLQTGSVDAHLEKAQRPTASVGWRYQAPPSAPGYQPPLFVGPMSSGAQQQQVGMQDHQLECPRALKSSSHACCRKAGSLAFSFTFVPAAI